jgi:hypothetical protein
LNNKQPASSETLECRFYLKKSSPLNRIRFQESKEFKDLFVGLLNFYFETK